MADSIEVPLGLGDFVVDGCELVEDWLEVRVHSTFPPACWHCGSVDVRGHGANERRVRDLGVGRPTVLVWTQRRLRCSDCGRTSRERHPAIGSRRQLTDRFHRRLYEAARTRPFSEVATEEAVSHWRVVEAFDAHTATRPDPGRPRILAIDESSFRKRFRFHTALFDPEARRALDVIEGRSQGAAEALLWGLPPEVRAGVEAVVIDCYWPFRKAIAEVLPGVAVIADRFHVTRSIDTAAARVRTRYGRRSYWRGRDGGVARQNNPRNDRQVTKLRWVFAGRRHHLDDEQLAELRVVFARLPEIGVAWWMKEAFAAVYESPDRAEAERRLAMWEHNLVAANLTELTNAWRTMAWWREEILAYFAERQTNGFAEGVTNKIKVMKRRAYGFRNPDRYRRKVLTICAPRS